MYSKGFLKRNLNPDKVFGIPDFSNPKLDIVFDIPADNNLNPDKIFCIPDQWSLWSSMWPIVSMFPMPAATMVIKHAIPDAPDDEDDADDHADKTHHKNGQGDDGGVGVIGVSRWVAVQQVGLKRWPKFNFIEWHCGKVT